MPDWARVEFDRAVVPSVFRHARSSEHPTLIQIGGQPGAGKTLAQLSAIDLHPGEAIAPIIGDDLRAFHPDYRRLMETAPLSMPDATAPALSWWVEAALEHARQQRSGVLVEGTFRRPEITLGTAKRFHEAGYQVHVVAVAVPPWKSRLSTLERFATDHMAGRAARWTDVAAHDAGVVGTPRTIAAAAASTAVQRITVLNRSGTILFDAQGATPRGAAVVAHRREQNRAPSRDEFRDWQSRFRSLRTYLETNVPATDATRALPRALHHDSVTLSQGSTDTGPVASPGSSATWGPKL